MSDYTVARCNSVEWRDDYGTYWLVLDFRWFGSGVGAMFDCAALSLLMPHATPAQVSKPEDLKGKLFQLRWDTDDGKEGHCGNVLKAIRIHPAYAENPQPWLKSQILLFEKHEREAMRALLEIADGE